MWNFNVVEKLIQQPNEETYKALHSYGSQLLAQLGSTKRPYYSIEHVLHVL